MARKRIEDIRDVAHSFLIGDVERYGSIEKALIVKEIRSMNEYKLRNGKNPWVYYSAGALEQKFPYMAADSIKRWMRELAEKKHLLVDIKNKVGYDRTRSYLLPEYEGMVGQNDPSIGQNDPSIGQNDPTIPPHSTPHSTPPSLPAQSAGDEKEGSSFMEGLQPKHGGRVSRENLAHKVIEAFMDVDERARGYHARTGEIRAAKALVEKHGLEDVLKVVATLPQTNKMPYFPRIYRPAELEAKWQKWHDAVVRHKADTKGGKKQKVVW